METFFIVLLAALVDPIRWIACVLSAWFIPSYLGALAVGMGVTVALSALFATRVSGESLLAGAIASAVVVSIFYFWRQSRRKAHATT